MGLVPNMEKRQVGRLADAGSSGKPKRKHIPALSDIVTYKKLKQLPEEAVQENI